MALSIGTLERVITPNMANQEPEIWIGYNKNGRNYLDKQAKALNTEQQIRYLSEFYKLRFSVTERAKLRWLWCQRPVVQICEVMTVNPRRQIRCDPPYADFI